MLDRLIPYRYKKWSTLLGGLLIHLSIGSFYTFGNLTPYLTSYLREYDGLDVRYSDSVWIFTSHSVAYSFAGILGGLLNSVLKINIKLIVLAGCLIMLTGVGLTFFTIKSSLLLSLVTYGIMIGAGTGLSYLGPLSLAMKWFPNNKGLANSVMLFGYGGSSIIFDQIQTIYINPDNFSPDKPYPGHPDEKYFSKLHIDLLERVPKCFLLMCGLYLTLQLIGVSLIAQYQENPEEVSLSISTAENENEFSNELSERSGDESLINSVVKKGTDFDEINSLGVRYRIPTEGMELSEALRNKFFYMLLCLMTFAMLGPITVVTYYKTFGQTFINDDFFLGTVGSVSSFFNACGRLFWGYLMDRFSFKLTYISLLTLLISVVSTLYLTKVVDSKAMYFIWVCLMFFSQCGIYATLPTVTAKTFGQKNFTAIYGFISISLGTSYLCLALIGNFKDGLGWPGLFILGASFSSIAWILAFFFNVKKGNGQHI